MPTAPKVYLVSALVAQMPSGQQILWDRAYHNQGKWRNGKKNNGGSYYIDMHKALKSTCVSADGKQEKEVANTEDPFMIVKR